MPPCHLLERMEALAAFLLDNDPEIVAAKQVMAFPSGHWKLLVEYTCRTHIMIPDSPRGSTPQHTLHTSTREARANQALCVDWAQHAVYKQGVA